MFGFGMSELVLILALALVVIGPKKLPEVAKALGKGYAEFRRAMTDFKDAVNIDLNDSKPKKAASPKPLEELYTSKFEERIKPAEEPEQETAKKTDEENGSVG